MASTKKKKILSKDELRRLMKQKQTTLKHPTRIEHPHAKYNTLNQIVCTICNTTIKKDLLWPAHLQSKSHKERVSAKSVVGPAAPVGLKRPSTDSAGPGNKKQKGSNGTAGKACLPSDFFDKGSKPGGGLLADYGSSSGEESEGEDDKKSAVTKPSTASGLPSDLFDKSAKPSGDAVEEKPKTMADVLPEGFFDDPKMDAKVRKVEFRDKMEDEWEMFQRAMKEETHVSEVIIEEDDEIANQERNIDEIDDQINRWKEIDDLHDKKEIVVKKVVEDKNASDSDEDLDEAELEELFDWRAKKTWK